MTTPTAETVEQLRGKAAKAAATAAEAAAKLEAREHAAWLRYEAGQREHDRARLAAYDPNALEDEQKAAYARLREALAGDTAFAALVDFLAAEQRRYIRWQEAVGDAGRLGAHGPSISPPTPGNPDWERLSVLIADLARGQVQAEEMERHEAREAAGEAAAAAG